MAVGVEDVIFLKGSLQGRTRGFDRTGACGGGGVDVSVDDTRNCKVIEISIYSIAKTNKEREREYLVRAHLRAQWCSLYAFVHPFCVLVARLGSDV